MPGADRKQQLRLVITSATLDGEKFSNFFKECPVLTISGRCFPVQVSHMIEKPDQPYLQLAVDKALDIHLYEPLGDILVFLTGQAEIEQVVHPHWWANGPCLLTSEEMSHTNNAYSMGQLR